MGDDKHPGTDVIDQLVDERLAHGEWSRDVGQDICPLCRGDWHGAPIDWDALGGYRIYGCPGAFATEEQRRQWQESWAYGVLRKAGVMREVRGQNTVPLPDPLTDPWPRDFCLLCGGDRHDAPLENYTVFDEGHLPSCPGSLASQEQHQRWLWQCRVRCFCERARFEAERIELEADLASLGYNHGQPPIYDDSLICGGG